MRFFHLSLIGSLLWLFTCFAHARNQSTVINQTDQNISVVWTALGCLHGTYSKKEVCAGRVLAPGHSHRYQYNWGATNDHIHIGGKFKEDGEYLVAGSSINVGAGLVLPITIEGNCRLPSPDKKVVVVRSITIDEKNLTINCDYSIKDP